MSCKNSSKDTNCCDSVNTSPQLTTKVSEHGSIDQMSSIIGKPSNPNNLATDCLTDTAACCSSTVPNHGHKKDNCCSSTPHSHERKGDHCCSSHAHSHVHTKDNCCSDTSSSCCTPKGDYPLDDRTDYSPSNSQLESVSVSGDITQATNPKTDPVAVNNISTSEFDTTEKLE